MNESPPRGEEEGRGGERGIDRDACRTGSDNSSRLDEQKLRDGIIYWVGGYGISGSDSIQITSFRWIMINSDKRCETPC